MLYNEGEITVDRSFARFGSKSYAINKINTVDVRERHPHGMGPVIVFGILALIFFFMAKAAWGFGDTVLSFVVIGMICAGVASWAWTRTKIVEYKLYLMTSSSENQALVTRDENVVDALREAIETAMSMGPQHELNVRYTSDSVDGGEMKRAAPSGRRRAIC